MTHIDGSDTRRTSSTAASFRLKQSIVSLLTDRALTRDEIDRAAAEEKLREAVARVAHSDAEANARFRDQERARQMLTMVGGA